MTFLAVCLFWIVVPGVLLQRLGPAVLKHPVFVPAASWVYLTAGFVVLRASGAAAESVAYFLYGGVAVLLVLNVVLRGNGPDSGSEIRCDYTEFFGATAVSGLYTVYYLWAGTYLEIPADVYSHLDKLHSATNGMVETGVVSELNLGEITKGLQTHWYVICGFLMHHSGADVENAFPYLSYLNTLAMLWTVYWVAIYLFAPMGLGKAMRVLVAIATTTFFVLHFGVNVFSYIRYYSLAPTMGAYMIFLGSLVLTMAFYRGEASRTNYVLLMAVAAAAAGALHYQELVFVLVMAWAMALVVVFRWARSRKSTGAESDTGPRAGSAAPALVMVAAGLAAGVIAFGASHFLLDRNPPHGPWMVPLSSYLPFVNHMFILNPRFQVHHVFAVWGYLVYLLFFLNIREFKDNYLVTAGMLTPFLTVFNPVFVDLYLRHQEPFTLYRMLYMVPFSFVGGFLLVKYAHGALRGPQWLARTGSLAAVVLMVIVLLPLDLTYAENTYSRVLTLRQVPEENHPKQWEDMLEALNRMEEVKVVTDPVTGYVVNGLTKQHVRTRRYRKVWIELDDQRYEDDRRMFREFDGYVLIVNLRGGGISEIGRISGHWPENILATERSYSQGLRSFIADNPEMFVPIWSRQGISMYRIDYKDAG